MAPAWIDQGPMKVIETPLHKIEKDQLIPESWGVATEMANVHNTLIRAFNSIYLQAPHITNEQDIIDFVFYTEAACATMDEHHTNEETFVFPLFEQHTAAGVMSKNVVQHEAFHGKLFALWTYIRQVKNGVADYDGKKICSMIDSFKDPLQQHLEDEVNMICELSSYDVAWTKVNEKCTEFAKAHANVHTVVPFMLSNIDNTHEGGIHRAAWPPFPWPVLKVMQWVFWPKYKNAWRFGSTDRYGNPQTLPFAQEAESAKLESASSSL